MERTDNPAPARAATSGDYDRDGAAPDLAERRRASFRDYAEEFRAKTSGSRQRTETLREGFADLRLIYGYAEDFFFLLKPVMYPVHFGKAEGCRLWDVDGNEYYDVTGSYGVCLCGNNPTFLQEACEEQLKKGIALGPLPENLGECAELIKEFSDMDRVSFHNSGTEAVMAAVRTARFRTGKKKIVMFEGAYHGWWDEVVTHDEVRGGMPAASEQIVLPPYQNRSLREIRKRSGEIAAVLAEPTQGFKSEADGQSDRTATGLIPKEAETEWLGSLKEVCRDRGIVFIMDEVLTGFRLHQKGAQAYFGVQADLVTYGKILGGGMPIGVVAGKADVMDVVAGGKWSNEPGEFSYPYQDYQEIVQGKQFIFLAGTFCTHPLTCTAAIAMLKYLREQGPSLQAELNAKTHGFALSVNRECEKLGYPLRIASYGSAWKCIFRPSSVYDFVFRCFLINNGVCVNTLGTGLCFFTTAFTRDDYEGVQSAVLDAARRMKQDGWWSDARPTS